MGRGHRHHDPARRCRLSVRGAPYHQGMDLDTETVTVVLPARVEAARLQLGRLIPVPALDVWLVLLAEHAVRSAVDESVVEALGPWPETDGFEYAVVRGRWQRFWQRG